MYAYNPHWFVMVILLLSTFFKMIILDKQIINIHVCELVKLCLHKAIHRQP